MSERSDLSGTAVGTQGRVRVSSTPDIITSEMVRRFHQFWLSRCKDGRLPRKSDMDPVEMGPFLSNILLTEVHGEPLDFKYRIIGEEIIARLGNMTGKRVRETALINVTGSAYQNYCAVVQSKQPQFLEGAVITAFKNDRPYLISRVHCPLSSDGETVDFIISYLSFL